MRWPGRKMGSEKFLLIFVHMECRRTSSSWEAKGGSNGLQDSQVLVLCFIQQTFVKHHVPKTRGNGSGGLKDQGSKGDD